MREARANRHDPPTAGPIIISGIVCGIEAVKKQGGEFDDDHKRWGFAILALYVAQLGLGAIIHWIKPTSWTVGKRRPAQNYFHAVLGILIIGLAFYQVRNGFRTEWPARSGRPDISNAANIVWYVWVVVSSLCWIEAILNTKSGRVAGPCPLLRRSRAPPSPVPYGAPAPQGALRRVHKLRFNSLLLFFSAALRMFAVQLRRALRHTTSYMVRKSVTDDDDDSRPPL